MIKPAHSLRVRSTAAIAVCLSIGLFTACSRSSQIETSASSGTNGASNSTEVRVDDLPAKTQSSLVTKALQARRTVHDAVMDPAKDGWNSEAVSQSVQQQLTTLLNHASQSDASDSLLDSILTDNFTTDALRPPNLTEIHVGNVIVRTVGPSRSARPTKPQSWRNAASELFATLQGQGIPRVQVKITQVQLQTPTPGDVTTRCLIEVSTDDELRTAEQYSEWTCQWTLQPDALPKLKSITVEDFQESESTGRWFVVRTQEVMHGEPAYQQQLSHGLNHWLSRIEVNHGMYVFAEYGMAVADVNNDGLDDLYICQPGGLPNRLLIHQEDGTVRDIGKDSGVDWLDHTSSALFVDFDNDEDQDLAIAIENRRVLLMENNGHGKFQLAQELVIEDRHVQGLCAADFNDDARVDLYLTVGFAAERARPHEKRAEFTYHDANEGGANVLFQNSIQHGKWRFRDVTQDVGLDQDNRRHSLAASWEDFDNDGDQDLYVANDYGQNCLYRNDAGLFTNVAPQMGVVDFGSGMSVSWSDYDRDGWMDLYVGNMFSSAGNRVTRQDGFRPKVDKTTRNVLERFAKGNTLFRNQAGKDFAEPDGALNVRMGRWAWSSPFADLNNDGWSDILVANGYITGDDERDL